jgi:hypothetical protein
VRLDPFRREVHRDGRYVALVPGIGYRIDTAFRAARQAGDNG